MFGLPYPASPFLISMEAQQWASFFLLIIKTMTKEERMLIFPYKDRIKQLIKERNKYKKAYETLLCYFDSISDEEKYKVDKILTKLGLRKN